MPKDQFKNNSAALTAEDIDRQPADRGKDWSVRMAKKLGMTDGDIEKFFFGAQNAKS